MGNDLITALIPTYNYGRFITQAVESVLAQTYRNLDIVVVDDGSTDDTRLRLAPYMDRIRYIYQSNQGLCAARNGVDARAGGDSNGIVARRTGSVGAARGAARPRLLLDAAAAAGPERLFRPMLE